MMNVVFSGSLVVVRWNVLCVSFLVMLFIL